MGFITKFLFVLNVAAWILGCIIGFAGSIMVGCAALTGVIAFFFGWNVSGGAIISTWDTVVNSEWKLFSKQIKWANGVGFATAFLVYLFSYMLFGG